MRLRKGDVPFKDNPPDDVPANTSWARAPERIATEEGQTGQKQERPQSRHTNPAQSCRLQKRRRTDGLERDLIDRQKDKKKDSKKTRNPVTNATLDSNSDTNPDSDSNSDSNGNHKNANQQTSPDQGNGVSGALDLGFSPIPDGSNVLPLPLLAPRNEIEDPFKTFIYGVYYRHFGRQSDPKRHRRSLHSENDETVKYSECGKKLSRPDSTKRRYFSYHTQDKHFECSRCDKIFSRPDCTKRHYRSRGVPG